MSRWGFYLMGLALMALLYSPFLIHRHKPEFERQLFSELCVESGAKLACFQRVEDKLKAIEQAVVAMSAVGARQRPWLRDFALALIEAERLYEIPYDYLLGVALVESRLDRWALSNKGAQGVFQILPRTARALWPDFLMTLSETDPLRRLDPSLDSHDIRLSTLLGAFYLKQLSEELGGLDSALAGYWVGPTRLRQARRNGEVLGTSYIRRVQSFVEQYRFRRDQVSKLI